MAKTTDLYMQFKDVSVALDAANPNDIVEGEVKTGMSIRGGLVWLIHGIEFFFPQEQNALAAHSILVMALSTAKGKAVMPTLAEHGTIAKARRSYAIATTGIGITHAPFTMNFLPPIPLASPSIFVYAKEASGTNHAELRGEVVEARLLFTTVPMEAALYTEIAETWGY